jgi:hypothetical protein
LPWSQSQAPAGTTWAWRTPGNMGDFTNSLLMFHGSWEPRGDMFLAEPGDMGTSLWIKTSGGFIPCRPCFNCHLWMFIPSKRDGIYVWVNQLKQPFWGIHYFWAKPL